MPRGGKRKGTGRPKGSGENREPTKTVRVPLSFAEKIPELLKQYQEKNSIEDLKLPAKAHEECLPLEGLAWDAFEAFCFDLIARLFNPQKIYHYGRQGDNQQGIDIVADLNNGEKWAFQCKQWQQFNRGAAVQVIDKTKGFEANRYILLLSRVASVEVRKVIANSPAWEVWDVRDISQKVRELPLEVARRLVRDHFHLEWQNAFLGISRLTPFISSEDFFHSWLDENRLFNHSWKLEGRDDVLKSLHEFVESSEKSVAILSGRGGIGKTKLLYEFAKTFDHSNFLLWFVEKDKSITSENADSLPLHSCVIVVDDAHQRDEQDIKTLLALIHNRARNQHPEIKVVLSSRPYAVQLLQAKFRDGGIGCSQIQELDELKELDRSEMKALAHQALGQDYAHRADQLAAIAYDSPLVAVVGGRLLANQAIPFSLLERNQDFQYEVLNRFQEILVGQVSQQIKPEHCKKILELMASVAPIRLTDEQFQKTATEFLGIKKKELIESIAVLGKAGVLLQRGTKWRITPDVLADYILHKACLTDQGDSKGYSQEIFDAFREFYPTQVLRNLAELDWRVRFSNEQETNLLDTVLQSLREEFKQASNLDRYKLLDLIKEIAYYQPEYSLKMVQFAMRHPATAPEDESIPECYRFTHYNVLSKLPEILNRISYTLDYVPICCDLLWQMGRDDPSRPYNNPPESIRVLIDLAKYGIDKSLKFNWKVLEAIERWLQEPDAHDHIYSPLDILDSFFEKEIKHNDYDGRSLKIKTFSVDHKITQSIRVKALKLIKGLLTSDNIKDTLRSLESLRKALKELHDRSNQPIEEANRWWEPEQLEILEMIDSLVTRDIESLVQLKVIEKIDWYARWSSSNAVQQKTQNIIDSIPRTYELKLTGTLSDNYRWNSQADESLLGWEERKQFIRQIIKDLAESFLKKYSSPYQGIQILNKRLQMLSTNGIKISTNFLSSLAELNPSYSIELCEQVLEIGDCPLAPQIASMLYHARGFDVERAIKVFQVAVNSGISSFCQSFAEQYCAWKNDITPDAFRELIQKLLLHIDLKVKKSAIASLAILIQSQSQLAISLALDIEINENMELAEELFSGFNIHLDLLTEEELEILLDKLKGVCSLSAYHISEFFVYAVKKIPSLVLQLILKRIETSMKKNDIDYDPLPSSYYENCLHHLSDTEGYENILREIRDLWFDHMKMIFSEVNEDSIPSEALSSFKLEPLYKELYKEASYTYIEASERDISPISHKEVSYTYIEASERDISPTSLKLLDEWINSEDAEKIRAASRLINEFHAGFIFGHLKFVSNLLEQAYQAGDECYEAVSSNLFGIAVSGVKIGKLGKPFPADIQLLDQASAIAKQFFKGSPVRRFFDSLVKCAESDITSYQMFYEECWE
ncbi:MAG: restriction endonuclease [Acaryochloris sp. RU_4_1]|nr:restriction endonuclease [Acaryochloris sp. SU_5_25]NJM67520.1 restriction endonuclease [Acaryochloris sp. RU_4_1]